MTSSLDALRRLAVGVLALAALSGERSHAQAAPDPWPRYNDPVFALLAPVDALTVTTPAREVLDLLDRLQPQIDAAGLIVQGRAMLLRAMALRRVPDLAAAERAGQAARSLGARAPHPFIEFDALILLFSVASDRGDLDAAAARLAEAAPLADRTGDALMRINVRLDQGRVARARGRTAAALPPLDEAIGLADRIGNVRLQIQARGARSSAKLGISDFDGGLADAQRGYDLARGDGVSPDLRGAAAFSLGQALSQIGDLDRGLELYTESGEAYAAAGLLVGVSLATRQRMDVRFALEDYDGAAQDGERARELFTRTGSSGQEPALLARMALIETRRGHRDAAAVYARDAAAKMASAQPRVRMAVEADLALSALEQGDAPGAAAAFTRVLERARTLRDQDAEWRALHGLGRAALARSDVAAAHARFAAAIVLIESMRRALPEAGLRADFVAERLGPYDGLITTTMAQSGAAGDFSAAQAFETAERARGRALADLLAEARARLTDPAVARIRAQEADFARRLTGLQQAIGTAPSDAAAKLAIAAVLRAERDYEAFVVRIRRDAPRYGALAHPRASSAADIAARLTPQQAIVSFWVGADRGVAWVITRRQLRSYPIPGRRDLDREVSRLNAAIAGAQLEDIRRIGAGLHNNLFQGLEYALTRQLIIVPDGPLWRAPFAALATDAAGGWLIERAAISTVASASLLAALPPLASRRSIQPAIVFGLENVPAGVRALKGLYDARLLPERPLAFAKAEAESVARLTSGEVRSSLYLNERADESSFKRAVATPSRVLHVASHAMIDDRAPRRSALLLASSAQDDGLLQLNEIANLHLDVDLVVLSTCQSYLGRAVRGEGLVSLSRAFLYSGARAVTAALWAVDDRETARLMPLFYTSLRGGAPIDEALRSAQLQMIRLGGASASPKAWAAFVAMGQGTHRVFEVKTP